MTGGSDGSGFSLVVVGCSWGGPRALAAIVAALPARSRAALAVVQHRGPRSADTALRHYLTRRSPIPVEEVMDKTPVEPGRVFLAPCDYHLLVDGASFSLSTDEPVNHSRPSIDVLFETAADSYGPGLVAVVLTGANEDGAAGLLKVKESGGRTIVQDPDEAERRTMPEAALATGAVDEVLTLASIADRLRSLMRSDDGDR